MKTVRALLSVGFLAGASCQEKAQIDAKENALNQADVAAPVITLISPSSNGSGPAGWVQFVIDISNARGTFNQFQGGWSFNVGKGEEFVGFFHDVPNDPVQVPTGWAVSKQGTRYTFTGTGPTVGRGTHRFSIFAREASSTDQSAALDLFVTTLVVPKQWFLLRTDTPLLSPGALPSIPRSS